MKIKLLLFGLLINFFFQVIPYFYPLVSGDTLLSYQAWFNAVILMILILPSSSRLHI
jgi:hypothetical protein